MLNHYIKNLKIIFLLFILWGAFSAANAVDISQDKEISLLENSSVYLDEKQLNIEEVLSQNLFHSYQKPYMNIGMLSKTIWIQFTLENSSPKLIEKSLILTSPLLEHIALYKAGDLTRPSIKGVSHMRKEHHTLFPYYPVVLEAHSSQQFYLEVKSALTPIDFMLKIKEEKIYLEEDRFQQLINILLIGFVLGLALYSFILFFYVKNKSYLYYSFYLFALIYQQITYLGLTQIYFPLGFIAMDMNIPVFKVNILIITAALFAMHFLKIQEMKPLQVIYKGFIVVSVLEILVLSSSTFYNLYIVIFTGALFIIFNLTAGVLSYQRGYTQARLFIVGFGIVFISYVLIILDAIGLTSIMQDFQNILMFGTAFEALILSLAFADRYIILQKEKEVVDKRILQELKYRNDMVKDEVLKKTKELNHALDAKELLIKEVHHRVKNNLQIILSMIRLQNDEIEDEHISKKFIDLENRINAISKTYNMLLLKDDLEEIDMQEYIDSLLADVHNTLHTQEQEICIRTDIDAMVPLRESVYIGLIVNELVTNAYKYAFDNNIGSIYISLHHNNEDYILTIEDDGKGFVMDKDTKTLGLKLIHTLVYDQLGGEMEVHTNSRTKYTIRFSI